MNSLLNKEPVKRAEKSIKEFDQNLKIVCLEQTARTAQDAATALGSMSNNPQSTALTTGLRMEFRYVQWTSICAKTQFEFSYRALAGPTDGTGWSSVSTSFNGNLPRSAFSITGGGNSSTYISCLWSGNTSTRPTTNQSFTVFA